MDDAKKKALDLVVDNLYSMVEDGSIVLPIDGGRSEEVNRYIWRIIEFIESELYTQFLVSELDELDEYITHDSGSKLDKLCAEWIGYKVSTTNTSDGGYVTYLEWNNDRDVPGCLKETYCVHFDLGSESGDIPDDLDLPPFSTEWSAAGPLLNSMVFNDDALMGFVEYVLMEVLRKRIDGEPRWQDLEPIDIARSCQIVSEYQDE